MSNQFKPGDSALIVGARRYVSNIGKTCELVELLDIDQISLWIDPQDNRPIHNASGLPCWLVTGEDLESGIEHTEGAALCLERHLMPLHDESSPEQQKAQAVPV